MANDSSNLGDIVISVGGDLSPLETSLGSIPALGQQAAAGLNTSFTSAAAAGDQLTTSVSNAASALSGDLSGGAAAAGGALADADTAVTTMSVDLGDLGTALMKAGAGVTLLTAPIAALGLEALRTAAYFEQTQIAFTTLLGSADKAQQFITDLTDFAMRTPFEIRGLVDASKQLLAMGFAAEQIKPMLTTLGDAISALGTGDAGLKRLTLAFGEMQARGTIAMKELNQLAMAGIPAMEILAKQLDMTHAELMAAIKKRTIDAATAIPLLLAGMNEKFGGLMAQQAQTFTGLWSNVKDATTKTLLAIGNEILPTAKSLVEGLYPVLNTATDLAKEFGKLPEPIKEVALAGGALAVAVGPLVLGAGTLAFSINAISTALPLVASMFGATATAATADAVATTAAATATTEAAVAQTALTTALGTSTAGMSAFGFSTVTANTALVGTQAAAAEAAVAIEAESVALAASAATLEAEAIAAGTAGAAEIGFASATATLGGALVALGPILAAIPWVVLAYEVVQLGIAAYRAKEALDALADAGAADQKQMALMEISLRQQGIDISELSNQYHSGAISAEQFTQGVGKIVVAFRAAHPAVVDYSAGVSALGKATQDFIAKQQGLAAAAEKAKDVYDQLKASVGQNGVTAQMVTAAYDEWQKALGKAGAAAQSMIETLGQIQQKTAAASADFRAASAVYEAAVQAFKAGKATQEDVAAAWDQLSKAAKAAHESLSTVQHDIDAAKASAQAHADALGNAVKAYDAMKAAADKTATGQLALAEQLANVTRAAKELGLAVDSAGQRLEFSVADKSGKAAAGLQILADQFNSLYGPVEKAGVIINGKFVPVMKDLTDITHDSTGALRDNVEVIRNVPGAAGEASGAIVKLTGDTSDYRASLEDLSTTQVMIDDEFQTAASLVKQLADEYTGLTAEAEAAAKALEDAASSQDDVNSASTGSSGRGRGGHGGGGGMDPGSVLSMYAQAGALDSTLDQLASAMGLVKVGNHQYATQDYLDAQQADAQAVYAARRSSAFSSSSSSPTVSGPSADEISNANQAKAGEAFNTAYQAYQAAKLAFDAGDLTQEQLDKSLQALQLAQIQVEAAFGKVADGASSISSSLVSASTTIGAAASGFTNAYTDASYTLAAATDQAANSLSSAIAPLSSTLAAVESTARTSLQAMAADVAQLGSQAKPAATAASQGVSQGLPPMSVNVQVTAGTVVGQGGMQELAQMVSRQTVSDLRTVVGLK